MTDLSVKNMPVCLPKVSVFLWLLWLQISQVQNKTPQYERNDLVWGIIYYPIYPSFFPLHLPLAGAFSSKEYSEVHTFVNLVAVASLLKKYTEVCIEVCKPK